jgi:arylsulfatase A-like enzyme
MHIVTRAALIVIAFVCLIPRPARAADDRPNILLLISDDQSWCYAGYNGDPTIRTPAQDRIAREGVIFANAHTVAASCTPSRASLLTGRPIWQLGHGAVLWGTLPAQFRTYADLLADAGYAVAHAGKGWGPGDFKPGGRTTNPAGARAKSFDDFLKGVPKDQPFCFWFGSRYPHRKYVAGSGIAAGIDPAKVRVPPMLPDVPDVRSDVATHMNEIQKFDAEVADILASLEKSGRLDNTLILITSDNGMPFPRGKATLYEYGTHMPLAIRWPGRARAGRTVTDYVSHVDLCPTILEAAGVKIPTDVVGRSLLPQLTSDQSGQIDPKRDRVYLGNERHADARAGQLGYPRRAVRTADFLYIRNYEPDRWPAGDPPVFADVDPHTGVTGDGLSKDFLLAHRDDPQYKPLYDAAFGKKPAEELYDLKSDPAELRNVAADPSYADGKRQLSEDLDRHLTATQDPRAPGATAPVLFDTYKFFGGSGAKPAAPNQ